MKNYRIIKGKKIHVNQLAAMSRQFSVRNSTIPKTDLNSKNVITMFREINTANYDVPVKGKMFEIDKDGHYHLIEVDRSWKQQHHKQPKRLIKCKKRKYSNYKSYSNQHGEKELKREKRNDFVAFFPNYPYTLPKMNIQEYMEKLVEHKTNKWEKKNPKPQQDLFDKVEDWLQRRENAIERFRDFVVSIYDKLPIMGNIVDRKSKKMKAIKIGEIRDVDGKGHNVDHPHLNTNDKLYKHAEAIAISAMKMDRRILDADLMNHKRNQKRPLNVIRQPIDIKKAALLFSEYNAR